MYLYFLSCILLVSTISKVKWQVTRSVHDCVNIPLTYDHFKRKIWTLNLWYYSITYMKNSFFSIDVIKISKIIFHENIMFFQTLISNINTSNTSHSSEKSWLKSLHYLSLDRSGLRSRGPFILDLGSNRFVIDSIKRH